MSRKIVAISGGENGRFLENGEMAPYETEPMDREIINLTNKKKPNFLFLAHSMMYSLEIQESYFQTMKKIYGGMFGCECRALKTNELCNVDKVKELIKWADIIYEGGGDTLSMIKLWQENHFDKALFDAWNNGKVICGVSAGAVCWFNACNSDSIVLSNEKKCFEMLGCLNWINMFFTPHCDEKGRYQSTKIQLKDSNLVAIIMSNCSAIEIIDDKYRIIVSNAKRYGFEKGYGYKAYWNNGHYYECELQITDSFLPLKDLLEKNILLPKE